MNSSRAKLFLVDHSKYLTLRSLYTLEPLLDRVADEDVDFLYAIELKNPEFVLLLSVLGFFGLAGLDRVYIGDVGLGILKFITLGGLGLWTVADLFFITERTKQANAKKLEEHIMLVRR